MLTVKSIIKLTSFLILVFFFCPKTIFATESIKSFNSSIVVSKDGVLDITETIDYDFSDNERHGIFRYIPRYSKVGDFYRVLDLKLESIKRDGEIEQIQDESSSDNYSYKIGRPTQTVTGVHTYEIHYQVKNAQGNFDSGDEIYWNVNGNGWEVPIDAIFASIVADFPGEITKVDCFTGGTGSTEKNCNGKITSTLAQFTSRSGLSSYQGLSVVAGFLANTFPKATLQDKRPGSLSTWQIGILVALGFGYYIVLPGWLLIWYLRHKRKKRFGKPSVNFDIPKDEKGKRVTPAEAGVIDNVKLEQNDVIATIFDFAIRKFIKIEEIKKKKVLGFFGDDKEYLIKKLKEPESGELEKHEQDLFKRLFKSGDKLKISELRSDFYNTFDDMKTDIFSDLIRRNFYIKNPSVQRGLFLFFGIAALITANLFLAGAMFWFYKVLNGRTSEGDLVDFKVDGLKLFLKNMSREYKWQADNLITVEKYIPYAMALGYIDEFMKQLKIIYPNYSPNWYVGTGNFYAFAPSLQNSMTGSITTNAPSSSSGFSGGGFSGGGGGGGGGGSW